ncbi:MAG: hypothetical protein HOP21_00035 [Methylotenera sp.]|nr:hypothetical protein [Methylotenera sp.]
MSDFSDYLTMKIIEQRRIESTGVSENLNDHILEQLNMNRNLNVRTKVDLISRIEVLADFMCISKAKLVTEMLESCAKEAYVKIEKEGWLDSYLKSHYKNLETQYGIVGIEFDEAGNPTRFKLPETDSEK